MTTPGSRPDRADLIWLRPPPTPAAPRVALSRDQITTAAVVLADADGVEALSMRQLAAALGCGVMSLYRYVRTKDELLELMIDAVAGEELEQTAAPTGDWRADLRSTAQARRASTLRHPWLPGIRAGRPCLGPNVVAASERELATVAELGLPIEDMIRVIRTVDAFVQGFVQLELADRWWRYPAATGEGDGAAEDPPRWYLQTVAYLRHLSETGDYPQFTRMLTEGRPGGAPATADADFEWQLDRILDGVAAAVPPPPLPDPDGGPDDSPPGDPGR